MNGTVAPPVGRFSRHVHRSRAAGRLVVQPRMGFATPERMRAGLAAVRDLAVGPDPRAVTAGTVTLDSFTRVDDHRGALRALRSGAELNGFPLVVHGPEATRAMLAGIVAEDFPLQVRHGCALPLRLLRTMAAAGVDATEGGPVSYCLPYGRVPLRDSVLAWARCCELIAAQDEPMHLESFGGSMLGQLCPPSVLVALTVLEALFFRAHGVRSVSVSYAQQTHPGQDLEALSALRRLAGERLTGTDWHVVLYTFMGVFPRTPVGAFRLVEESARLAVRGGADRLVVKTPAEAHRIPTVAENVDALEFAAAVAADEAGRVAPAGPARVTGVYEEAALLVDRVLELTADVGEALVRAFAAGLLDVPYCLHPDNANRARARVDPYGVLRWADPAGVPVARDTVPSRGPVGPWGLLGMLSFHERRCDAEDLLGRRPAEGVSA
ncbi:methylaspartate mutase [Streptomyces sp. NPDC047434]|uniref:methylaspartate mutase n=1 Tax=Streptomyces sp. NPDC047434 TaxID=3155143 RepID=UPI00340C6ACD